jgi:hypothetical protein
MTREKQLRERAILLITENERVQKHERVRYFEGQSMRFRVSALPVSFQTGLKILHAFDDD